MAGDTVDRGEEGFRSNLLRTCAPVACIDGEPFNADATNSHAENRLNPRHRPGTERYVKQYWPKKLKGEPRPIHTIAGRRHV